MSRFVLGALIFLGACSAPTLPFAPLSPTPTKPQVTIIAPLSGTAFAFGTEVIVQSVSTDANGIVRVDLLVDGQVVRSDTTPSGTSQTQFPIAQTWKASAAGTRAIVVRATNSSGAFSEAMLSITVNEPPSTATHTRVVPSITPGPTVLPPSASKPTTAPAKTITPSAGLHTLTLTEAQVNALINAAIASGQIEYVSNASVSLQNGQIAITASYTPPGLKPINGKIVLTARASNCTLDVTVVQATLGVFVLNDAQKAALGESIEQVLKNQLPQQTYCIDSITIANGVMTIKYH